MSKKTTVTEYFDENGNLTSRITETEDDSGAGERLQQELDRFNRFVGRAKSDWAPPRYPVVSYCSTLKS